jgi:glycosyltransferase involved in cell wall biosynthesis
MQSLYDGLDAFVFPSLCESFGFPLIEAMARGVPVVVARTPSNVEIAGAGALAFPPEDWRALADAVESLMSDPAGYRAQASRSLATARGFSWNRAALGTLDAIERTLRR